MSQSLSQIFVHVIFSTKNRKPFLKDKNIREKVHQHLEKICGQLGCKALIVGGVEDHIHLLLNLNKNTSLSSTIEKIKKYSSRWIKSLSSTDEYLGQFYWQSGFGAFSVSQSNLKIVETYIKNQEQHHKKLNFQNELRKILELHDVKFDERYLWG